jgi:hypothetical protein
VDSTKVKSTTCDSPHLLVGENHLIITHWNQSSKACFALPLSTMQVIVSMDVEQLTDDDDDDDDDDAVVVVVVVVVVG